MWWETWNIRELVSEWSLPAWQKVYPWLRYECYEDDEYEKRHWWNRNVNVIKNDYHWAKNIVDKSERWCIKSPSGGEKCVELLIINNIWMEFRDRDLALKLFFAKCDDQCFECEQCTFVNKHNDEVLERYDILNISRWCNACRRVTCKCSV